MSADFHTFTCPHCNGSIIVHHSELNCRIFRHGAYLSTMDPIPPHLSKEECDRLVLENRIAGCGKPFRIDESLVAVICDYI